MAATAAATEHSPEGPVIVVYVNIDWKSSRMYAKLNHHMGLLTNTIKDIVMKMKPTVICMCEVGETVKPLSEEQMLQVAATSISAWEDAATISACKDVQPRSMYTTGYPYMTIYNHSHRAPYLFQCSGQKILHDLYKADGQARTAQAFVLSGPGGVSIDVINVHAPSGLKILKDTQRHTLLKNLLQTTSQARLGLTIGSVPFLIGGDMNTAPYMMS